MKKILSIILTLVLITGTTGSVFATSGIDLKTDLEQDFIEVSDELIQRADRHINIKNNQFYIINETELKKDVTQKELFIIETTIYNTNMQLNQNYSSDMLFNQSLDSGLVVEENALVQYFPNNEEISYSKSAYEGVNKVEWHWWGAAIFISKTNVEKCLAVGSSGAGAVIGMAVGGGPIGAIVAAAVGAEIVDQFVGPWAARAVVVEVGFKIPLNASGIYDFVGVRGTYLQ